MANNTGATMTTTSTTTSTATPTNAANTAAYQQNAGLGGLFGSMMPLLLVLLAFYFLVMRPQQKRDNQRKAMIDAIKRGDRVITSGGIIGTIHKVISEREISLQISENVRIRMLKAYIGDVLSKDDKLGKELDISADYHVESGDDLSAPRSKKKVSK